MLKTLKQRVATGLIVGGIYGFPLLAASFVPSDEARVSTQPQPTRQVTWIPSAVELTPSVALDSLPGGRAAAQAPAERSSTGSTEELATTTPHVPHPTLARPRALRASATASSITPGDNKHKGQGHRRRGEGRACLEGTGGAIVQVNGNRYTVQQDLFEQYSHDLQAAMSLAWVGWHRTAGKIDGFVVRRIRCGSPLYEAGLRNGDVIQAINGNRIDNYADALAFFIKVRRQEAFHLKVRRDGERMRLHYRVV